ncbi:branched-chain amino acid ABC transporter permease [Chelativorans sp. Marseille-P2723]|uniref:branched-chain amino acid ABC transporter permease n=1 Tax=Chelativorans sp. Marseille-P2723 TaxID=2709133 RepID=UPI00156E5512|nr:branched-chain amino acid ABC transporter permease [Chelativorans sp. Marseille-P2723]
MTASLSSDSAAAAGDLSTSRVGKAATVSVLLGALVLAALPMVLPNYQVSVLTEVLIFAVLAMSIDMLAGYAGRTSLCHGAIFGTATYMTIWLAQDGSSIAVAMIAGVLMATMLAAVFGMLAIRTSGVYFLLLTLALGMVVWGICLRWTSVTGGENGLRGPGRPEFLNDHVSFYYVVFVCVALITLAMWRIVRSPFGLTMRGIRDSESRMQALGYNVPLHMFAAFTISGFFAGMAGALYAVFNNFVSPSAVALVLSVEGLLMTIVGGVGTLFGGFIGAAAIIALENVVSLYTERWQSVLGAVFIIIMIFAPDGVLGRLKDGFGKWTSRSSR